MKMTTLGTVITMISGIGAYAFVMSTIVLATHNILPEDPDGMLFYIGTVIVSGLVLTFMAGIIITGLSNRRERKKQKMISDSTVKKNTVVL